MARITGSLASVNSVPTEGTVLVRALTLRPGSTFAVTGEPKVAVISGGRVTIEVVEPGPVQLTIQGNGATHDVRVDVPDEDEVDFLDLLETVYDWEPAQISAVKLAAREARKAADEAGRIAAAFRDAEQLEGWAESASASAAEAGAHADRAEGVAESVQWDGDRLTVAGKTSPPLRGPKGDRGEPGPPGASTWGAISGKPETYPPEPHTHDVGSIDGLTDELAEVRALAETRAVVKQVTTPPDNPEPGVLYVIPE